MRAQWLEPLINRLLDWSPQILALVNRNTIQSLADRVGPGFPEGGFQNCWAQPRAFRALIKSLGAKSQEKLGLAQAALLNQITLQNMCHDHSPQKLTNASNHITVNMIFPSGPISLVFNPGSPPGSWCCYLTKFNLERATTGHGKTKSHYWPSEP